jgi:SpoVK/Ycf46/Vps4 family AAA+-type ATPase
MEKLNLNNILEREELEKKMINALNEFKENKNDPLQKRGIYIYGAPGSGKTTFALSILEKQGYDIIKYDAGDIRNKTIIELITKHNMSDKNVVSMFYRKVKPIVIVMDEIDGMNNGDKGGINSLIKLIRPKKTKKQKLEDITLTPIVCISNYHIDKKIKELMKVCTTIEIKTPTNKQVINLVSKIMPNIELSVLNKIIEYLQGDLRKLKTLINLYSNNIDLEILNIILKSKSHNEDTKDIAKNLIRKKFDIEDHLNILNETDRTIVGLLWHENIVDVLDKLPTNDKCEYYVKALDNICFADYIDRITFQKQIWQFNEMSSLIKTFYTNKLFHDKFDTMSKIKYNPKEVRFTKVLTKYSTEYNNYLFIQNLCQKIGCDKKDLISMFLNLKNTCNDEKIQELLETYELSKLDINRMYRYIDKYLNNINDEMDGNEEYDGL